MHYTRSYECHSFGLASSELSYCSSLMTQILGVMESPALSCVFNPAPAHSTFVDQLDSFIRSNKKAVQGLLKLYWLRTQCPRDGCQRYRAILLQRARDEVLRTRSLITILDETHNFSGKTVESEDNLQNLDASELIAKEGRK